MYNLLIIRDIKTKVGHACGRRGRGIGFRWESQKERNNLEYQGVDRRMGSELILGRLAGGV
jgi:hypothetical protein